MSASKGKKYERDVCTRLRDHGFIAERIRGSGGGTGTRSADILFVEPCDWPQAKHTHEVRGEDRQGLSIGRALEQGLVDEEAVWDAEIKYRSDGFSRVYTEQWRRGVNAVCQWQDNIRSAGISSFRPGDGVRSLGTLFKDVSLWRGDEYPTLTNKMQSIMDGEGTAKAPDFVFVRRSKQTTGPVDWVVLWDVDLHGEDTDE